MLDPEEQAAAVEDNCNPQQSSPTAKDRRPNQPDNGDGNSDQGAVGEGHFLDMKTTLMLAQERLRQIKEQGRGGASKKLLAVSAGREITDWRQNSSALWPKQIPVLSRQIFASDESMQRGETKSGRVQIPQIQTEKKQNALELLRIYGTSSSSGEDSEEEVQTPQIATNTAAVVPAKRKAKEVTPNKHDLVSPQKRQRVEEAPPVNCLNKPREIENGVKEDKAQIEQQEEEAEDESSEYNSEEEHRREQEQLKGEIFEHLRVKQEPLTMQQLSYQLKTGKKFIDEALEMLLREKKVLKRSLVKNTVVYFVPLVGQLYPASEADKMTEANKTLDTILSQLREAQLTLEKYSAKEDDSPQGTNCLINTCQKPAQESIDSQLLAVERSIKAVKQTPSEAQIRVDISAAKERQSALTSELITIKGRADYLGKRGALEIERFERQLQNQRHLFWLRKRACIDLVEVFSELHGTDPETLKERIGLPEGDYQDKEVQELLEVYDEVKKGLDGDEEEEEESEDESEEEESGEAEQDELGQRQEKQQSQ